jgi:hypothetical protein
LFVRSHIDDDFVCRKRRQSVADRETDVGLAGYSTGSLARKLLRRAFGDSLRVSERLSSFANQSSAPWRTTGTTTLIVSASPT